MQIKLDFISPSAEIKSSTLLFISFLGKAVCLFRLSSHFVDAGHGVEPTSAQITQFPALISLVYAIFRCLYTNPGVERSLAPSRGPEDLQLQLFHPLALF